MFRLFEGPVGRDRLTRGLWRRVARAARAVLLLAMAALAACARSDPAEEIAMTVGGQPILLGDFEEAFWGSQGRDAAVTADTSGLRRFVPIFIDKVLQENLCREVMPVLEGTPRDRMDESFEKTLVDTLRRDGYGEAYKVDKRTLEQAYELLGKRLHLRHILVGEQGEAEQIYQALREGAVFNKVVEQQSQDLATRQTGGDLGWLVYTDLDPRIREPIYALQPGDITRPIPWGNDFQIFKLDEVGVNTTRGTLEQERPKLELLLRGGAVQRATEKYQQDLMKKYHFQLDAAQVSWMTVFLREKTSHVRRGLPTGEEGQKELESGIIPPSPPAWTSNPVPPADSARVLASFDPPEGRPLEGRVLPGTVLDQLSFTPSISWPLFQTGADVEKLIKDLVLERLEIREALARKIDKRPEIQRILRNQEREIRNRYYYRTQLRAKLWPTEEQTRVWYEAHIQQYREPERRRFAGINTRSREIAHRAAGMLREGRSIEDVVRALAPADTSLRSTGMAGTRPMKYGESPMLDDFVFRLPLHGISDPIPVGETYTVAKVIEITPAHEKPFADVKATIQANVSAAKADSALTAVLEQARSETPVEVHWDTVMRARLHRTR